MYKMYTKKFTKLTTRNYYSILCSVMEMKINTLSKVLIELRKEKNLTQREVAEKINTTQRAYAFYEKGDREPSIDTLIKLADLYNVPIDILVGRYKLR